MNIPDQWYIAVLGGVLIGSAAVLLMLIIGKIAGISGILAGALRLKFIGFQSSNDHWQIAFVIGLILSGFAIPTLNPDLDIVITENPILLIIAGLLVGYGTRLGNGCTSGHSVCGIGRLSLRSIVATVTFMVSGIITVSVMNYLS